MHETGKSADVLAAELTEYLADILGGNGVSSAIVLDSRTGRKEDRIRVEIDVFKGREEELVESVHAAVMLHTPPVGETN